MKKKNPADPLSAAKAAIIEHDMIPSGSRVVAAVSGGPDSVVLALILSSLRAEFGFELIIAHLDHQLRPESAADAEFTAELACELRAEFAIERIDVAKYAKEHGVSVEEAGRLARYDFFARVAAQHKAPATATAHNLDDQVETFLLRLLRGSSPTGLRGILPKRGAIIRPLINCRKSDLLDFLHSRNMPYRLDSSNLSEDTDRNYLRNRVIPVIAEHFPSYRKTFARTIALVQRDDKIMEQLADDLFNEFAERPDDSIYLPGETLRREPASISGRVILKALYELSGHNARWTLKTVESLLRLATADKNTKPSHTGYGVFAHFSYGRLVLSAGKSADAKPLEEVEISGPGLIKLRDGRVIRVGVKRAGEAQLSSNSQRALFDADLISFPLALRGFQPGDRFDPWGIPGTCKLKKLFIDLKIPKEERVTIPLITNQGYILWVAGVRRSKTAPVTANTRAILEFAVVGEDEE